MMNKFKELFENTNTHGYDKNTEEELELLLKHHKEDLEEYEGDDTSEIEMDIKEIQKALADKQGK